MNKKAISPLIATMLLIVMAVSIGAIVYTWNRGYFESTTEAISDNFETQFKCDLNVGNLDIATINGSKKVCYDPDNTTIHATVENKMYGSSYYVKKLFVRVILADGTTKANFVEDSSLRVAEARSIQFDYGEGIPVQVKIFPLIRIGSSDQICIKSGLTVEEIYPC